MTLICLLAKPARLAADPAPAPMLMIDIVEGDGAINDIKLRTAREVIVEVDDENHKPVAGAAVTLSLARHGNLFRNIVLRATTDSTGRVNANPLQLKGDAGRFEIRVKAQYQGRVAKKSLRQTNAESGASAGATAATAGVTAVPASVIAPLAIVIAVGVIAGAAVGGMAAAGALGGGGKSISVSVGTPHF